jgi:hypothetical protein
LVASDSCIFVPDTMSMWVAHLGGEESGLVLHITPGRLADRIGTLII